MTDGRHRAPLLHGHRRLRGAVRHEPAGLMETLTRDVEVAVEWWVDQLDQQVAPDNGDAESTFTMQLLTSAVPGQKPTEEQFACFRDRLAREITAYRQRYDHPSGRVSLGVDYGPDLSLHNALEAAGLRTGLLHGLPMKTHMSVYFDKVEVSAGYGVPWVTLWEAD